MNTASKITDLTVLRPIGLATRDRIAAVQYLTFYLADEQYGVDILKVREIHDWATVVTRVPDAPAFVRGVMNLHGTIVPVIDLRLRFDLDATGHARTVIVVTVRTAGVSRIVGVVVDGVSGVLNVEAPDIQPAPDFGTVIDADFIGGLVKIEDGIVMLLNTDWLLGAEEILALTAVPDRMVA